jgi:leucyl-tRNA synthetase
VRCTSHCARRLLTARVRYGQTNCFVGPNLKYGVFAASDTEAYVCTLRAARNMAFQGIFSTRGQVNQLAELDGAQIVGTRIHAPLSVYSEVHVLPMETVLATKVRPLCLSEHEQRLTYVW